MWLNSPKLKYHPSKPIPIEEWAGFNISKIQWWRFEIRAVFQEQDEHGAFALPRVQNDGSDVPARNQPQVEWKSLN